MSENSSAPALPASNPGLLKSSSVVGGFTMLSRVLGLVRDATLANVLGSGGAADAFFVAFKIPNFMRRLFAEGAFAQAFVPVLSEYRTQGSHAAVRALIDRVAGSLGSVLFIVTLLAMLCAPFVATVFAPGFRTDPAKFALVSDMIRITFPYLLLISLTGFAGAILNSYGRFVVPAFTPVLLNISLIVAACFIAPLFATPVFALAWGVLVAGILQLVFQLPFLYRLHLLPVPKIDWQDSGVKRILVLMVPALFGVSVSQINLMLDTIIASLLPSGSVSWLYYSERLSDLPLGVFAVAIATVILPSLSRQHASQNSQAFSNTLDWAIRLIYLIALPAIVALVILAEPMLMTLFQHGETTLADITMMSFSMRAYALGLVAFMLIKVLAPGFYAKQNIKTPVRIGIIAMLVNMLLNVLFVVPLHIYYGLGHVGLALATSLAAYLNAYLLYRGLKATGVYHGNSGWLALLSKYLLANAVMAVVLLALLHYWQGWADWQSWQRIWHLMVICLAGLGVYLLVLLACGIRPSALLHQDPL